MTDVVTPLMSPIEVFMHNPAPWLAWIIPVIGALLMPVLGKVNHKIRDYGAVVFAFCAVLACASMIPSLFSGHTPGDIKLLTWFHLPNGTALEIGLLVDPLSIIICNVVAFISFLIVVYSTEYMHGDPHLDRFWFLFLFFIANMLLLVLSDNLIQTMIGWEGVGLCSYGLIGYYYRDDKDRWLGGPPPTKMFAPSECGMKAFVVTGIGDVFILASIFIIYYFAGTFNYQELIHTAPEWLAHMGAVPGLLGLTAILFLGGPIGKSAQFPLHEWLPEAMAGPTSVSALIHAATMVKAGVYLVARMSPVFYIGAWFLHIPEAQVYFIAIACVGAFTCFLAASQAVVSAELKKILAYSTVSQIGYMMLGLGLSGLSKDAYIPGLTAGIFHLMSHALFKAALFLCAGSVIHAIHSIYTFDMGGLKKYMPKTYWLMLIATLSLAGIPPFSGFWSKDAVFIAALAAGTPLAYALLAVGAISAAMTMAYSIRYIWSTFLAPESKHIHDLEHHGHPPHESPATMWAPIAVLVVVMLGVSALGLIGQFVPDLNPEIFIEHQLEHAVHALIPHEVEIHVPHIDALKPTAWAMSGLMLVIGASTGWYFYLSRKIDSWEWVQASKLRKAIHTFLWNRWYMNSTFYLVFVDGTISLSGKIYNGFEQRVMTPLSDAVAKMSEFMSQTMYDDLEVGGIFGSVNQGIPSRIICAYNRVKKVQTGLLSMNLVYMALMFLILILAMWFLGGL